MKLARNDLEAIHFKEFRNAEMLLDRFISGVSTDSRAVKPGDIFVALRGDKFDGHKFVFEAISRGAGAVIVDASSGVGPTSPVATLVVADTTKALGELAHIYRKKFAIPVLAIGGSNGKTTTKEMVAAVLAMKFSVLRTRGNLNNHIGVPQTLFELEKTHRAAVVEIGTNHPGEIEYLCTMLDPTHGLITNVGREHLEYFKSVDGVAQEEGVLFRHLDKKAKAIAFVNGDDPHVVAQSTNPKRRVVYGYGGKELHVRGRLFETDAAGCVRFSFLGGTMKRWTDVRLAIPGQHNAMNALAAVAVGLEFGVPPKKIREALESFRPANKRMEVVNVAGITVYNDTYNANPDSTIAALRTLASVMVEGKRIAVLADMLELGATSHEEHARVGKEAGQLNIDYLLTFGKCAKGIHDASGLKFAFHYDQKNVLAEFLAELASPGDAVLVKGSRGMQMEDVVTFLQERLNTPAMI